MANQKRPVPWGDRKHKVKVPLSGVNVVAKDAEKEQSRGWALGGVLGTKAESRTCER